MDYNSSYTSTGGSGGGGGGATSPSPTPSAYQALPSYVPTSRSMLPYAPLFSPQSPPSPPPSASSWQGVGESLSAAAAVAASHGEASSTDGQTSPYARYQIIFFKMYLKAIVCYKQL